MWGSLYEGQAYTWSNTSVKEKVGLSVRETKLLTGREIWYLSKIGTGLYLSLLLWQQLKLVKCIAFMTPNSLQSFLKFLSIFQNIQAK